MTEYRIYLDTTPEEYAGLAHRKLHNTPDGVSHEAAVEALMEAQVFATLALAKEIRCLPTEHDD